MRKFTLYQASRFTKISRYKLEQAINDGILNSINGRGNIKCYINEEDLNNFIEKHADQYRRFSYPENFNNEDGTFIPRELHDQIIAEKDQLLLEKDKVISLLEFQNAQLMNNTNDQIVEKSGELKSIIKMALDELPESSNVKEKLEFKLNKL